MIDWFGTVLLAVPILAFLGIIVFEFLNAIRARTISLTGAGRITVATGFLIVLLEPIVFPGLAGNGANTLWWFGAAMIGVGVVMETFDRRKSGPQSQASRSDA